ESAASNANVESVMLEYAIDRGRPTRLDISGFDVPNRIRQQMIRRWASAIFDGFLERDATLIVREYLYSVNRLQATVTATAQRNDADDGKTLHVRIDPGDPLTARLVFDGNAAISTAALVETTNGTGPLAAWFDPAGFALMVARLYHDAGLLSAEINVQPPQIQQAVSTIQVVIREGEPWSIGRVAVDGAGPLGNVNAIEVFGL